jgi:creatinine amidohydrolase/Fe(II)-dependent formamide hydrolase-like protein
MGDYMVAEKIALHVARQTGDLVFPALPFGYSEHVWQFPGTVALSPQCLYQLAGEVLDCLIGSGFRHIVIVNGHRGNKATLLHLVRDIRRERHLLVPIVSPLDFCLPPALWTEIPCEYQFDLGDEPMSSLMAYLFPGTVDMSRTEDWGVTDFHGLRPSGLDAVVFEGVEVLMGLHMEDIAPPSGSLWDPRMCSTERGQRIADESVARLARFMQWFKGIDPQVKDGMGPSPDGKDTGSTWGIA